MKADERKVFTEAIAKYGEDEQMRIAQEECAELIQAISKYHRAQSNPDGRYLERAKDNLIEEIADVSIMVDQLKLMVKGSHTEMRAARVQRLAIRMKGERR